MYKRRDWLLFHGQDGEGTSSDEDSEIDESAEKSDDDDSGIQSEEEDADDNRDWYSIGEGSDIGLSGLDKEEYRRLEDLSEDDFDDNDSDDEDGIESAEDREIWRRLGMQIESWLDEEGKIEQPLEQQPLRCILCPKTLLLNPHSLRSFLASEKYKKRAKKASEEAGDEDPMLYLRFSSMVKPETEATETHAERLQRVRKQLGKAGDHNGATTSRKRTRKGKKLGKRQRMALKQDANKDTSVDIKVTPETKKQKTNVDTAQDSERPRKMQAARSYGGDKTCLDSVKVSLPNKRRGGKKDKTAKIPKLQAKRVKTTGN